MKRLLKTKTVLLASVVIAAGLHASPALSAGDDFDAEFQAMKKKIEAGKASAGTEAATKAAATATPPVAAATQADPLMDDPLADPLAAKKAPGASASALQDPLAGMRGAAGANPLGPAANLPVSGQMPATGNAMSMSPDEMAAAQQEAADQKAKLKEEAFKGALESIMPLTPDQVRRTMGAFRISREAAETPYSVPEPKTVIETISLDPSAPPAVIKLSPNYVTTVSFLDQTGAPWAIQDLSWAGKFDIVSLGDGSHMLRITPRTSHGVGNISIRLVDLITPITMNLSTGLDEVYYRYDARIPKQGPLAKTPLIEYGGLKTKAGTDDNLVGILDGTAAADAVKLKLDGTDGRTTAYRVGGVFYLRTPLTLLSPAWDASTTSADGMNVYTFGDAPVILLSDRGHMVKVHVMDN